MDFPRNNSHPPHHHHHHHRRDDDREDDYPPPPPYNPYPPPPSYYGINEQFPPPPPPQVSHVYHSSHFGGEEEPPPPPNFNPNYFPPPPPSQDFNNFSYQQNYSDYPPPPPNNYSGYPPPPNDYPDYPPPPNDYPDYPQGSQTSVQHVSHESGRDHHRFKPHMPSFVHHHSHHQGSEIPDSKPPVRVFTKAKTDFSLTIRNGKVILAPSDPSDPFQHWIKDEKYSTKVKDEQGYPSFALINKATGEAIKHSIGATHPVQLIPYRPDVLDESVLWTMSKDLGDGFRTIRMINNIRLNVDAFNGDQNHGGVHDGTTIVLWEWKKGDNQRWNMVPY